MANDATITPHAEAFQAVVWHLLVSHPKLRRAETQLGVAHAVIHAERSEEVR